MEPIYAIDAREAIRRHTWQIDSVVPGKVAVQKGVVGEQDILHRAIFAHDVFKE